MANAKYKVFMSNMHKVLEIEIYRCQVKGDIKDGNQLIELLLHNSFDLGSNLTLEFAHFFLCCLPPTFQSCVGR